MITRVININIPIKPLSINAAFQGRRFKTRKCKQYEKDVFIHLPKGVMIEGYISIMYEFYLKNFKMTDADNLVKVLQDCIVKQGIIEDDRKIVDYAIYKYPSSIDRIEIFIKENKEAYSWFKKGQINV